MPAEWVIGSMDRTLIIPIAGGVLQDTQFELTFTLEVKLRLPSFSCILLFPCAAAWCVLTCLLTRRTLPRNRLVTQLPSLLLWSGTSTSVCVCAYAAGFLRAAICIQIASVLVSTLHAPYTCRIFVDMCLCTTRTMATTTSPTAQITRTKRQDANSRL